jgi:hypothetical protein
MGSLSFRSFWSKINFPKKVLFSHQIIFSLSNLKVSLLNTSERLNALTMLSMSYQAGMNDADSPESQEHPIQSN